MSTSQCPFQYKGLAVNPRDLVYHDFPKRFVWNKKNRFWTIRKKGRCVGRVYFMSPKSAEPFHLRLLLTNIRGATSFEDLRTVEVPVDDSADSDTHVRVCDTLKEACITLGLADNDGEWHAAMKEATGYESTATMMRGLFITLLTECNPGDPFRLWDEYKTA